MRNMALLRFLIVTLLAALAPPSCTDSGGGGGGGGGGYAKLDFSFGTKGIVTTNIATTNIAITKIVTTAVETSNDQAFALAIQADGKLVAAGSSLISAPYLNSFALVRYNPDGSLDPTFNATGKVTTTIGATDEAEARALVIQADGKLVAAGFTRTGSSYTFALIRYNPDGSLDTTFNTTGIVTTAVGVLDEGAFALAIQADGKLVAAGYANIGPLPVAEFALVRYNTDGSLDTTFNSTGIVTTAIGVAGSDVANALAIQADGKLVAAGLSGTGTSYEFALVRYNQDGSLDPTFNTTGKVTTAIDTIDNRAYALAIQADGKLVAAGYSSTGTPIDFALIRYNQDGSLDSTFNATGIVTTTIGEGYAQAYALAIQADGKLVAAGTANYEGALGTQLAFALARYNPDGSLDPTFNATGIVTTTIGTEADVADALAIQADGMLVAAGSSNFDVDTQNDFALHRYLP